jgi:predicted transcriptional regulator
MKTKFIAEDSMSMNWIMYGSNLRYVVLVLAYLGAMHLSGLKKKTQTEIFRSRGLVFIDSSPCGNETLLICGI